MCVNKIKTLLAFFFWCILAIDPTEEPLEMPPGTCPGEGVRNQAPGKGRCELGTC